MKLLKLLLPCAMIAHCFAHLSAVDDGFSTVIEARERDTQAVQDYINTKRAVSVNEKGGDLKISGDIRSQYYYIHSRTRGIRQRGYNSRKLFPNSLIMANMRHNRKEAPDPKLTRLQKRNRKLGHRAIADSLKAPYATSEFDIEANLVFDYVTDRSWGTVRMQMSNPAGTPEIDRKPFINDARRIRYGSGKVSNITLRKAFMGYNIWEQGTSRFDVEMGRRRLYDAFDSRIQFYSLFDGLLFRFTTSFEGVTDFYAKAAAFVVDYTTNHFGYVGETGFMNILDSGFDLKYSLIDWNRRAPNRFHKHHPLGIRFVNSQITAAYNLSPDLVRLKTQIFGAFLVNHAASKTWWTHDRKANQAFYAGFTVGQVVRKGDYALDFSYQYVQAQAVPENDVSTISRDNPRGISFYNRRSGGFANFKGFRVTGFYAITDNWTIETYFEDVHQACRKIGGKHHSNELSISAIFAF